ncbi:MAG TPA: VWA domain-containing protein, partial [Vicinamibacterales bacterium]|nr:VWA domain-containing protein [Vicinamibacterales bacterium]
MRRLAVIALTTLATAGSLSAQAQAPRELEQTPQATFKSGVALVTVSVAVRTENGRVVRDLQRSDFTVIDAGQPTQIKDFYVGDSPISLAILLDISGSMAVGGNMDRAREAVAVATMNLRAESDEAALFTFDSQLQQVVEFTKDLDRIRRVSLKGTPWGKTSLYDAVADTATTVSERANRHRALLVITDGVDTGSRLSAAEVSAIANSIDVPVYLLTVVSPLDHPGTEFEVISDGRSAQTATLEDLARWTGGDMRIASTPAHTSAAIEDLFTELRNQYLISFEPGERTGWHPLEIRTRKRGLVVHAR